MTTIAPALRSKRNRGLSLLQLLLVVAILAILAALLFPAVHSAKEASLRVQCTNNLRGIYLAAVAFSNDYNGKLPPALGGENMSRIDSRFLTNQYWWGQAYLGRYALNDFNRRTDSKGRLSQEEAEIFNCPARFKDGPDEKWTKSNAPGTSYVMRFLGSSDPSRYRLAQMKNTGSKVFVTEGRGGTLALESAHSAPLGSPSTSGQRVRRYHQNGLNLLFFDGHVEPFNGSDESLRPMIDINDPLLPLF